MPARNRREATTPPLVRTVRMRSARSLRPHRTSRTTVGRQLSARRRERSTRPVRGVPVPRTVGRGGRRGFRGRPRTRGAATGGGARAPEDTRRGVRRITEPCRRASRSVDRPLRGMAIDRPPGVRVRGRLPCLWPFGAVPCFSWERPRTRTPGVRPAPDRTSTGHAMVGPGGRNPANGRPSGPPAGARVIAGLHPKDPARGFPHRMWITREGAGAHGVRGEGVGPRRPPAGRLVPRVAGSGCTSGPYEPAAVARLGALNLSEASVSGARKW